MEVKSLNPRNYLRMMSKNFLRFISQFLKYNDIYSVLEIMRRMNKVCQRVGNGEELFYSDKDVLKKVENLSHILG